MYSFSTTSTQFEIVSSLVLAGYYVSVSVRLSHNSACGSRICRADKYTYTCVHGVHSMMMCPRGVGAAPMTYDDDEAINGNDGRELPAKFAQSESIHTVHDVYRTGFCSRGWWCAQWTMDVNGLKTHRVTVVAVPSCAKHSPRALRTRKCLSSTSLSARA